MYNVSSNPSALDDDAKALAASPDEATVSKVLASVVSGAFSNAGIAPTNNPSCNAWLKELPPRIPVFQLSLIKS